MLLGQRGARLVSALALSKTYKLAFVGYLLMLGIDGNEQADTTAKEATRFSCSQLVDIPVITGGLSAPTPEISGRSIGILQLIRNYRPSNNQ